MKKKKKKEEERTDKSENVEKKEKKKEQLKNSGEERKLGKKNGQKLRLTLTVPPCVFNYQNAIRNRVMETENTISVFSISITHHSKIK